MTGMLERIRGSRAATPGNARTVALVVAGGLVAALAACGPPDHAPEKSDTDALGERYLPIHETRYGHLGRRSTLSEVLEEQGLSSVEALALARSVDRVWSVRSLRPETSFTLLVDREGSAVAFEMWPEELSGVRARRAGETWLSEPVQRPVDRHVRFLSGRIEDSLYDAVIEAGGDAELVAMVSDVLQWDLDFYIDPRPGDRFAILCEEWVDGRDVVAHGEILAIDYVGERVATGAYRHSSGHATRYYRLDGTSVRRTLLKSPLNYRRISSTFSHRRFHPILRTYRPHLGVDYAAPVGTPIVTIGDGMVAFACQRRGLVHTVEIRHNSKLTTHYAHLSRFGKGVRAGARVSQGQVIGYVGSSGLSTGPHLDFRCKVSGRWVNPLTLDRPVADPIPAAELPAFRENAERHRQMLMTLPCSGFLTWEEFEQSLQGIAAATSDSGTGGPG